MTRLDALILSTPLIAVMVVLCAVLLFQRRGRNRRVRRDAWSSRQSHPSFWDKDRRGHTECR